jgi:hypothetical protein
VTPSVEGKAHASKAAAGVAHCKLIGMACRDGW